MRSLDTVDWSKAKATHQCRVFLEAKNSESVCIDGFSGRLWLTYGVFYHVGILDRVELPFGHLP